MITELSESEFPPGGWQFTQPQSGWEAPTPKASTFSQTVIKIIEHRLGNPAMVAKYNLAVTAEAVGKELKAFTYTRLGITVAPSGIPVNTPAPGAQSGKCCGQV